MEYKKIIVITGVSSGIGKELVKKLTGDTSNLVIGISRNNDRLETLRLELMHPENCQLIAGDISDPHDISDITVKLATHGRIDALIHNAGKLLRKPLEKTSHEDLVSVYGTNVFGPALLSSRVLHLLRRKPSEECSHVVHISSMGGVQGTQKFAGLAAYSSSKAALTGLAECMAEEWKNQGIRSNVLAIGSVSTEMFGNAFPGLEASTSPEKMADFIADFALKGHRLFNGKVIQVSNSTP